LVVDAVFVVGDAIPSVGVGTDALHYRVRVNDAVGHDQMQVDDAVAAFGRRLADLLVVNAGVVVDEAEAMSLVEFGISSLAAGILIRGIESRQRGDIHK
jgi:hypothetical protein